MIGASVRPSTHTSLATHAVGCRGSSPGASTRPVPPGSTATFDPSSTANIRNTTDASPSGPPASGVVGTRVNAVDDPAQPRQRRDAAGRTRSIAASTNGRQLRRLDDTRPVRIGERHAARPHRLQHAGTPERSVRRDLERIDGRVLEPPVQHVDRLEPVERAQPHPPLAHDEVGALDEMHAELHREVRVVDVRRMVETAREHDDARARLGRRSSQRPPHRARVAGDRGDLVARHHVRHDTRHHRPVEQRVPDAGRRVGQVLHDVPLAILPEREVDGVRRQPPARRGTDGVDAVAIGRRQRLGRHDAIRHQRPRAVQVADHGIQRPHPLGHDARQPPERRRVEHDRDRVDPPRPALDRRHATVGAHRQVVHEVAGTVGLQQPVGALLPLASRSTSSSAVAEAPGRL